MLIIASQQGHLEVVKFLVEKGVVVDHANDDGNTALVQTSRAGHLEVVEFLLSAGADINHLTPRGLCPLYAAAQEGHLKVIKLLVKKGANVHQESDIGIFPLHQAALKGQQEVVDYLIGKGSTFEATGTLAKVCKCCGADDAPLKCGLCLTVYYCCKACQKKDWMEGGENSHKVQCKSLIEIRARYVEKTKKEIEEKMARFGVSSSSAEASGGGGGPNGSAGG
jgi:hypothetical protein